MKAAVKTTQGQSVCWGGEGCSVTRPGRIFQLLCASWARQGWEFNNLGLEGTLLALGVPAPPGAPLCCAPVRIHHTHTHPQQWTAEQAPLETSGNVPSAKGKGRNCGRTCLFCNYGWNKKLLGLIRPVWVREPCEINPIHCGGLCESLLHFICLSGSVEGQYTM